MNFLGLSLYEILARNMVRVRGLEQILTLMLLNFLKKCSSATSPDQMQLK